jgi:hypothetical protein
MSKYTPPAARAGLNFSASSHALPNCGKLSPMGNKDKGQREKRKPKKATPKFAPPKRETHQVPAQPVRDATTDKS